MYWLLAVNFLGLLYFSANQQKVASLGYLRLAWQSFAVILIVQVVFTMIRSGSMRSASKMAETEFWLSGMTWALFALGPFWLIEALVPASVTKGPNLPESQ
jgi:hypothetical protein